MVSMGEDMNKTLLYVDNSVSELYGKNIEEAVEIIINFSLPKLLEEIPDFIQHYDADYWAKETMESITKI